MQTCPDCGGTILPPAAAGVERGTCHCSKPGRLVAHLFYGSGASPGGQRTYGVEWDGVERAVEPPTLSRAYEVLNELRAQWRAQQEDSNGNTEH